MNKHIVKYLLALATIAFVGGGCNVDDYNEEYLDGFNPDKEITDVQVLKYTMTDADFASVASNTCGAWPVHEVRRHSPTSCLANGVLLSLLSSSHPANRLMPSMAKRI